MLCLKCGAENPAEARFCGKCGTSLASGPPVIPASEFVSPPRTAPRKKWRLTFSIAFGAVAVLIASTATVLVSTRINTKPVLNSTAAPPALNSTPEPARPSPEESRPVKPEHPALPREPIHKPFLNPPNSDADYAQKIVGVWRVRKIFMGAFVDLNCSYQSNGRASWTGSYMYLGIQYPLAYGGTWAVNDGICNTRIESSNVPQLIPIGQTYAGQIITLTDTKWTYRDLSDGQTGTAERIQ